MIGAAPAGKQDLLMVSQAVEKLRQSQGSRTAQQFGTTGRGVEEARVILIPAGVENDADGIGAERQSRRNSLKS